MPIIIFMGVQTGGDELLEAISSKTGALMMKVYYSITDLKTEITNWPESRMILMGVLADENQMRAFQRLVGCLNNTRLILVLPDSDSNELVSEGYNLFPRYIGYLSDMDETASIIANMYLKMSPPVKN